MLQPSQPYYTVEEYLWQEQQADFKHDYYNGKIYAMAGGSPEHSAIQANVIVQLGTGIGDKNCRVFTSDLKIGVENKTALGRRKKPQNDGDFVTYPDVSLVCGPLQFFRDDRYTVANPIVLFEVLSPSTRSYDMGLKLEMYQKILSLKAYIMIDSEQVWVRSCLRLGEQNRWILEEPLESLTDTLVLETLNIKIPVQKLYDRVDFEENY